MNKPKNKPALDQSPPVAPPVVIAPSVRVKFLRSHRALSYAIGETAEISREDFEKYSQDGPYFEEITPETPENSL